MRKQIESLRATFLSLQDQNEVDTLLTEQEIEVDPAYNTIIQEKITEEIEDKRKELAWDLEYSRLKVKKLKDYVKNELLVDKFVVKALKNEKKSV